MKKTTIAPIAVAVAIGSLAITPASQADECRRPSINGTGVVIDEGRPKVTVYVGPRRDVPGIRA